MMPLGYAFGLLPALATGLLAARLGRMAGARGLHALASGALGAATSVVINFALFALHGMAGGAAAEQRLFPLGAAGFIAAFVCGLILHVGERGAAGSWARPTPS